MPKESTKTDGGDALKETPAAADAPPQKDEPTSAASAADLEKTITTAVRGKASSPAKGEPSQDDDPLAERLRDLETKLSKRLDKVVTTLTKKLEETTRRADADDPDDQGQPSQPSTEVEALRAEINALKADRQNDKQEAVVVNAVRQVQSGDQPLSSNQVRKAWEFMNTEQGQLAGFSIRNFHSPAGIRAVAFAAGALEPDMPGSQAPDASGYMADNFYIDPKTGEIKAAGIEDNADLSNLTIADRVRVRNERSLAKMMKGQV